MEKFSNKAKFEIAQSPIKEAYELLGAHTPLELSDLYTQEDQRLMRSGNWDYNNPDLFPNVASEYLLFYM